VLGIGGANDFDTSLHLARTPVGRAGVARLFADLEIVEPAKASLRRLFSGRVRNRRTWTGDWPSPTADRRVPGAPQV
jgi:hypothetical protein